jgi:hypothetical protein
MIALWQNYPIALILAVILPLIMIGTNLDSLMDRLKSDTQLNNIEMTGAQTKNNTEQTKKNTEQTLKNTEQIKLMFAEVSAAGKVVVTPSKETKGNDVAITAVLAQYKSLKQAMEEFEQRTGFPTSYEEKNEMATEVLGILSTNLTPVTTMKTLPSKPLILSVGSNTFKVLFPVPARIPPQLEFQGLPTGTQAKVIEVSKFGFTVVFTPTSVPIVNFGFIGNSRI